MAKSRVNSKSKLTKKSKRNVPKWLIAGVVVLVVAVAGYAIVRFSEAGSSRNSMVKTAKDLVGSPRADIVTINKRAGNTAEAWKVPQWASVTAKFELKPKNNLLFGSCMIMRRDNPETGEVALSTSVSIKNDSPIRGGEGGGDDSPTILNVKSLNNYCTKYINGLVAGRTQEVTVKVTNRSESPLYVTAANLKWE